MNSKNILDKVIDLFQSVETEKIEINLEEIVGVDGKIYNVDKLEVGSSIFILEDEEFVPLVDGEIEIVYDEKNWIIISDETGKILSIEEKVEAVEEMVEETPIEEETEMEEITLESLLARIVALEEKILDKEVQEEELKKENEVLKTELSKVPAGEPIIAQIKKFEFKEEKAINPDLNEWVKSLKK